MISRQNWQALFVPLFYYPPRGTGENPLPLGEDFSFVFVPKGFNPAFRGKGGRGSTNMFERFSLEPLNPCILDP